MNGDDSDDEEDCFDITDQEAGVNSRFLQSV